MQRVASEQTSETVVSVLHLPNDEMKGRIIGREGRNIRTYESVTGVNLIIDDTPEAVLLSCFDPVRREVGRLTLERLVLDGRIHPQRIEEAYEQSRLEVDDLCLRAARDALAEVGIGDLDERLLPTLGRLKYRTSYGQNVLGHLVETAHIAGVMAAELGIEPTLIKRCAFLHDIGKALTHEVEGSHAIIGADLLRRFGEDEAVAHAVEAHHNEVQPAPSRRCSPRRPTPARRRGPGARRESLEAYVKRLARIEQIAEAKPGVEKVFAMQAGREVRVMVQPERGGRPVRVRPGPRDRQADRGRAHLPRPDPRHGGARVPLDGDRALSRTSGTTRAPDPSGRWPPRPRRLLAVLGRCLHVRPAAIPRRRRTRTRPPSATGPAATTAPGHRGTLDGSGVARRARLAVPDRRRHHRPDELPRGRARELLDGRAGRRGHRARGAAPRRGGRPEGLPGRADSAPAFTCPTDGVLYFTDAFVASLEKSSPGALLGYAFAVVQAHEMGHVVQLHVHQPQIEQTDPDPDTIKFVEQQADCLSGVWAHAAQDSLGLDVTRFRAVAAAVLGSISDAKEIASHGTPAERLAAIDRGLHGVGSGGLRADGLEADRPAARRQPVRAQQPHQRSRPRTLRAPSTPRGAGPPRRTRPRA